MAEDKENYCPCNQPTVIKKGFSGIYAISGFLIGIVVSSVFIKMIYPEGHPVDSIAYTIASFFVILCLFAGTIRMNDLFSVCPKCGKITSFNRPGQTNEQE